MELKLIVLEEVVGKQNMIIESQVLVYYDVTEPMVLTCGSSPKSVGADLSHVVDYIDRPVSFASKSLQKAEQHYSQLHKRWKPM